MARGSCISIKRDAVESTTGAPSSYLRRRILTAWGDFGRCQCGRTHGDDGGFEAGLEEGNGGEGNDSNTERALLLRRTSGERDRGFHAFLYLLIILLLLLLLTIFVFFCSLSLGILRGQRPRYYIHLGLRQGPETRELGMSTSRLVEAAAKGAQSGGPTKVCVMACTFLRQPTTALADSEMFLFALPPNNSLTVGPPAGRIRELFAKVGAIEAKHGPFSALFVLGDFFEPTPASASLKGKSPETNGSGNGGEVEGEAGDGAGEKTLSQDARDLLDGKITGKDATLAC